ncbi:MAG: pseudouridine-5'-phosphate glycosidase [Acidimicrobiales bacterium]
MALRPTLSDEVAVALSEHRPVVALESTIFSLLGLPAPANADALERCLAAVRAMGAVPALTCVLDGTARVGIDDGDHERVLTGTRKVAERDLAVAVGLGWAEGMTTVSAALALAHLAGISVFATGGIGGVHRGVELTGDVSADLDALAHHPVICVSAGAKAFLDLARTLELLETLGVAVVGYRTDHFPAFYTRSSGLPVPHRVESADQIAAVHGARSRLDAGLLVVNPIPEPDELPATELDRALTAALLDAEAAGIRGGALTPFVLQRIGAVTQGRSVPANLALAEANAGLAADIAVAWSRVP